MQTEVSNNQAEVNWQYPMVHKYKAEYQAEAKYQATLSCTMEVNNNQT